MIQNTLELKKRQMEFSVEGIYSHFWRRENDLHTVTHVLTEEKMQYYYFGENASQKS